MADWPGNARIRQRIRWVVVVTAGATENMSLMIFPLPSFQSMVFHSNGDLLSLSQKKEKISQSSVNEKIPCTGPPVFLTPFKRYFVTLIGKLKKDEVLHLIEGHSFPLHLYIKNKK